MPTRLFVTVGTTRFDELLEAINAPQVQRILLRDLDVRLIFCQCGLSSLKPKSMMPSRSVVYLPLGHFHDLLIECFDFKNDLLSEIAAADIIITHCGAGSVLEILHLGKRAIAVVNGSLQDNHQVELADALGSSRLMAVARTPGDVIQCLVSTDWSQIEPYPKPDLTLFLKELSTFIKLD